MRPSAAASAAAVPAALGLLLAVAAPASAQTGCKAAFERWAQESEAQVHRDRGGCLPSETVRQALLDALADARGLCGDSSDEAQQPTRTMISINQAFISSLGVCRSEATVTEEGWSSKTAPEKAPPKIAAPIIPPPAPPAPPPMTGGPRPSVISPKPVVVAPPVTAPKADAGAGAPKPPCLVVAPQGDVYALVNSRCKGYTVLAVVESRSASGETSCKGYSIGVGLNLKGSSSPRVSYECVASVGGCNKDRLGDMFPECDW